MTYIVLLQILDLLWSDPQSDPGRVFNHSRGGGCFFGPDITEQFLKKHNMDLIIRSHECKYEGYEYAHSNTVSFQTAESLPFPPTLSTVLCSFPYCYKKKCLFILVAIVAVLNVNNSSRSQKSHFKKTSC